MGALALGGCGGDGGSKAGDSRLVPQGTKLSRLDISATETKGKRRPVPHYRAPKRARGGLVEIRFENRGTTPRKAQLFRVTGGHSVSQAVRRRGKGLPPWLRWAGGVGLVAPGGTGVAVQRLVPGLYYVTGLRSERRGVATLRISGTGRSGRLSAPAARITTVDYGFQVSGLKAGRTAIEFRNAGSEPHHAFFAPLRAGRTLAEAKSFQAGKLAGPPPVDTDAARETAVEEGGERQVTRLNLRPGRYVLFCIVRDRAGGQPHTKKGMFTEVKVP